MIDPLTWVPKDVFAHVGNYKISGGFFYVGRPSNASDKRITRYIDPRLHISKRNAAPTPLPYWPDYNKMTPEQRGVFLTWLGSGRSKVDIEIGYVFLYFYGLEQRLIVPGASVEEEAAITDEVIRLRKIYGSNSSFSRHTNKFLIAVGCRRMCRSLSLAMEHKIDFARLNEPRSQITTAAVTRLLFDKVPLDFDQSYSSVVTLALSGDVSPSRFWTFANERVIRVARDNFNRLYPSGFSAVLISKERHEIPYQPASGISAVDFASCRTVPELPGLRSYDWSAWRAIVLDIAYDFEASAKLTSPLATKDEVRLRDFLASRMSPIAVVGIKELCGMLIKKNEQISKKSDYRILEHKLNMIGYGVEPRSYFMRQKITEDAIIAIFDSKETSLSDEYSAACWVINYIAQDFNSIPMPQRNEELRFLLETFNGLFNLTKQEALRLRANCMVALVEKRGNRMQFTPNQLNAFNASIQTRALNAILGTLEKTKRLDKARIRGLERIYTKLGLSSESIPSLKQASSATTKVNEPGLTTVLAKTGVLGLHSIGRRPENYTETAPSPAPVLDMKKISAISKETEEVSQVLGEVLSAVDPIPEHSQGAGRRTVTINDEKRRHKPEGRPAADPLIKHTPDGSYSEFPDKPGNDDSNHRRFSGLPHGPGLLLTSLLVKSEWPRHEFDLAARAAGQMAEGALEAINDWAYENFDAPLIEGEDILTLNFDLLDGERGV